MREEYTSSPESDASETQRVKVTSNNDNCVDIRSKRITVSHIKDLDRNLGESYTYTMPYDSDADAFTQFEYMKDFHDPKTELNIDSVLPQRSYRRMLPSKHALA